MIYDLSDAENTLVKSSEKIEKILSKLDNATATAVINYVFLKMVLSQDQGPITAKAMAAVFLNNIINSVDSYYYGQDDDESVH